MSTLIWTEGCDERFRLKNWLRACQKLRVRAREPTAEGTGQANREEGCAARWLGLRGPLVVCIDDYLILNGTEQYCRCPSIAFT